LTTAVEIGLILAIILFTKRMSNMLIISKVLPDHTSKNEKLYPHVVNKAHDCPQISIYTIEGPLFFGAAQMFEQNILATIHYEPKVLILRMGKVPFIDTTGESYFRNIVHHFKKQGGLLLVSGIQSEIKATLEKNGLYDEIGENNFFVHTGEAITFALEHLDKKKCEGCKHFAFHECTRLSEQPQEIKKVKNPEKALDC
jgi:SulP family sulfate permease